MDISDINQNNRSEIFITSIFLERNQLTSFVLEWDGSKFKRIADKMNLHLRVIPGPEGKEILISQQGGIRTVFFGNVNQMIWDGAQYQPDHELSLPRGIDVYGFTYGDPFNNNTRVITALSENDRLQVFDQTGNREWESTQRYGGKNTFIEYQDAYFTENDEILRYYLHHRIFVTDFDKNGRNDIIAVQNHDTTQMLGKFRMIRSGHIQCLTGDTVGFSHKWKTRKISGYISDYTVGDVDNDGRDEVAATVVVKGESFFKSKQSYLILWNRMPSHEKAPDEM